ncbi:MAG: uroporphyrinogen-III synthase [Rhodospirillales bacterium]|nr:MAG: uroporphyrinogen-III synthase [Rhodospirillales bacterium]
MRILITRPREDAEPLAQALAACGVECVIAPVLDITVPPGRPLSLDGVQVLVATSANGVRAFALRDRRRHLPVYAVGPATAEAARRAGFSRVTTAGGEVTSLAARIAADLDPAAGAVLHIAGSKLAGDLAGALRTSGFSYRRAVLYEARRRQTLPAVARTALGAAAVDGVVFYSPRTARIFAELTSDAGLAPACAGLVAFCLSAAVADAAATLPWARLQVAARPDGDAMLALITEAASCRPGQHFVSPPGRFPC